MLYIWVRDGVPGGYREILWFFNGGISSPRQLAMGGVLSTRCHCTQVSCPDFFAKAKIIRKMILG